MNRIRLNRRTNLFRAGTGSLVLFMVISVISGCDFGAASDAFDEFDVIIELEPVNTVVAAGIVDARTGNYVATNVTLKFVGDDAGSVIDMYSDPLSEQTVEGGLTSFGIANNVVPTPANPVQFRVIATAAGYESGSATVTLTGVGDADVEIRLASRTAAQKPVGSGTTTQSVPTTSGTISTAVTLQTTSTSSGGTASVTVPGGTKATTSNGTAAQGQISASITYYQASSTSAVPLPTSSRSAVQSSSGAISNATISTVAAATIEMTDASGASITRFETPIEVRLGLDPSSINPLTGQTFTPGEQVEIFNYSEDQGVWVSKGFGTVVAGAGKTLSTLEISFQTLIAGTFLAGTASGTCAVTVDLTGNTSGGQVSAVISSGDVSTGTLGPYTFDHSVGSVSIPDLPDITASAVLTFIANDGSTTLPISLPGDCGTSKSVTLPTPPASALDVTFDLQISSDQHTCPTGALRVTAGSLSGLVIKRKKITVPETPDSQAQALRDDVAWLVDAQERITGGSVTVYGLEAGASYTFFTTIDGSRKSRDILITSASQTFDISQDVADADICAQ